MGDRFARMVIRGLEPWRGGERDVLPNFERDPYPISGSTFLWQTSANQHDLTEKLQILLDNEGKIRTLEENVSKKAKTRLNWKEVIERTEQVYKETLKKNRNNGS